MANTGVEEQYNHWILLRDVEGERVSSGIDTQEKEVLQVLRGELVTPSASYEQLSGKKHYFLENDRSVEFFSLEDDVSPLHYTDYQLLAAIESPCDRFATFVADNKLDWAVKLPMGSEVFVRLPGPVSSPLNAEWSRADIMYKGSLKGLPGMMFGVEIMEARYRGRGSTNGRFQGEHYFQCEENCGLFVSLDKFKASPFKFGSVPGERLEKKNQKVALGGKTTPPQPHGGQDQPLANQHSQQDRIYESVPDGSPQTGQIQKQKGAASVDQAKIVANTSVEQYHHWILLKDVEGERVSSGFGNAVKKYLFGVEKREVYQIPRGELVSQIAPQERSDRKPPHNYGLIYDSNVTFRASMNDVSPLAITDHQLLAAIESPCDRFSTFAADNKLDWAAKLQMGSEVFVRLPGPVSSPLNAEWSRADIMYKGSLKGLPGMMFGVEIMDTRYRGRGSTNGLFQGEQHFQCEENCGLFVSLDKLALQPPISQPLVESDHCPSQPSQQPSYADMDTSMDLPFIVNDRVVAYNKKGIPIHGRARWIGNKLNTGRDLGAKCVGIETDVTVYSKDFECAFSGMPDLFHAKHNHHLFLPLSVVIKEDSQQPGSQNQGPNPSKARHTGDGPHRAAPQEDRSPSPSISANDMGISKCQLMSEQERLLREGERAKLARAKIGQSCEEVKSAIPGLKKLTTQPNVEEESLWQQLKIKNKQLDQLKNDDTGLQQEKERLRHEIKNIQQEHTKIHQEKEELQNENTRLQEQLMRQRTEYEQLQHQLLIQEREAKEEKQRLIDSHSQMEQQLHSQLNQLQQQLDSARTESGNEGNTQLQIPSQEQDTWNVPRDEVKITGEIGRGGWGAVFKGRFKGQTVAVKKVFKEILGQSYTIRLTKREIQIMASVQHPNLVRFIAAVIDDKVDRGEETPLLVVELLDMDLRHAYKTTDLGTNRIPIFRDVAYALHYLHEHQEPIIHRDVSAPNVLLERLQGGTFRAKLSDFGSANKVKDARTAGPGAICYTAPEAFPLADPEAPMPPQTPKVDVYSYGILLAEVITKSMPTSENRRQLFREVKKTWNLMYDLICSCTKASPTARPTMATILGTLNRIPTPRPRQ